MTTATHGNRGALGALLLGVALLTMAAAAHAFEVKPGPEACRNAHAVIVASTTAQHDYVWREVGGVVRQGRGKWQVVDDYEPGVAMRVSFRQYDVEGREGATAYVAHCGHGGTCNSLVQAFFEKHPDWYSPEVFCGEVPQILHNPQSVSLP